MTQPTTLFCSPDGMGNAFTLDAPGPLSLLQKRVRALTPTMQNDIVVYFRGGEYYLDAPMNLNVLDGGNNGHTVTYCAYNKEIPIFTGGKRVSGWVQDEGNIWKADVSSFAPFRNLWVNGQWRQRAVTKTMIQGRGHWKNNEGICVLASEMPNIKRVRDLEYRPYSVGTNMLRPAEEGQPKWWQHRFIIEDILTDGENKILVPQKQYYLDSLKHHDKESRPTELFWLENAKEFLTEPGEWYFDRDDQILYYYPQLWENMSSVSAYAPQLEDHMLVIEGTAEQKVRNIRFEGLNFQCVAWNECNKLGGDARWQSQWRFDGNDGYLCTPGAIELVDAHDILFHRCRFENMGGAAVSVQHGCEKVSFIGNVIREIAESPVVISNRDLEGEPAEGGKIPKEITLKNNFITRGGLEYWGNALVTAYYCNALECEHNELSWSPWAGFAIGWGWGKGGDSMMNNKINRNKVEYITQKMGDGAFIYALSPQIGSECKENYFRNAKYFVGGIYFDEGSAHWLARNNVVQNTSEFWLFSWKKENTHSIIIDNNWYDSGSVGAVGTHITGGNIFVPDGRWPSQARTVMENAGIQPEYKDIKAIEALWPHM
jgi:hypothetical protein